MFGHPAAKISSVLNFVFILEMWKQNDWLHSTYTHLEPSLHVETHNPYLSEQRVWELSDLFHLALD